jgi:hypothetical protein
MTATWRIAGGNLKTVTSMMNGVLGLEVKVPRAGAIPTDLPAIPLPYDAVRRHWGGQAHEVVEKFRASPRSAPTEEPPETFKWTLEYERADDPPTDVPELFARILATNSPSRLRRSWLVLRSGPGWCVSSGGTDHQSRRSRLT